MLKKTISFLLIFLIILTTFNPIICIASNLLNASVTLKIDDISANTKDTANMYTNSKIYVSGSSNYNVKKIIYYWDDYQENEINLNSGYIEIPSYLTSNKTHRLNISLVANNTSQTVSDTFTYSIYYSLENNVNIINVNTKIDDINIYDGGYYSIVPDSKIYINGINKTSGYTMRYSWNEEGYNSISNYAQTLSVPTTLEVNKWHKLNVNVYNSGISFDKTYVYNVYLSENSEKELPIVSCFIDNKVINENTENYINNYSTLRLVSTHSMGINQIQYKINNGTYTTVTINPTNILLNNKFNINEENYIYVKAVANDNSKTQSIEYKYKININNIETYEKPIVNIKVNGDNYILDNNYYIKKDTYFNMTIGNASNFKSVIYNFDELENTETTSTNFNISLPTNLSMDNWHTLNIKVKSNINNEIVSKTYSYNIYLYKDNVPDINFGLNIKFNGNTVSNNQSVISNSNGYFDVSSNYGDTVERIVYKWNNDAVKIIYDDQGRITIPSNIKYDTSNTLKIYAYILDNNNEYIKSNEYTFKVYYTNNTYITPEFKVYINDNSINTYNSIPYIVRDDDVIKVKGDGDISLSSVQYKWNDESTKTVYLNNATISDPKEILDTNTLAVRASVNGNYTNWNTYYINFSDVKESNINTYTYPLIYKTGEMLNINRDVNNPQISLRNITGFEKGKTNFLVNEEITYNIDVYIPYTYSNYDNVKIEFEVPSNINVSYINTSNGTVSGRKITWYINNVYSNTTLTLPIKLKYTSISSNNIQIIPTARIMLNNYTTNNSKVIERIYKNTSVTNYISHKPYMYGDEGTNNFRPNDGLTRAEFCVILVRAFELGNSGSYGNFTDMGYIDNNYSWAKRDIITCYNLGLLKGYEDGSFRPDNYITKAELITILARVLNNKYSEAVNIYNEPLKIFNNLNSASIQDNSWYLSNLSELIRLNIVKIDNVNVYSTLDMPITRCETVNIVNSALYRSQINNTSSNLISYFSDVNSYTKYYQDILEATAYTHYYRINSNGTEYILIN